MADELLDARGVLIEPGDTVIYGFGVSRSVAMAEGVVEGVENPPGEGHDGPVSVSLTASGRVRVKVIRRSYSSGEKPVIDLQADRMVVLKPGVEGLLGERPELPPSPLPTQAEEARKVIEGHIESYKKDLRSTEITWGLDSFHDLAEFHAFATERLAFYRKRLKALDG